MSALHTYRRICIPCGGGACRQKPKTIDEANTGLAVACTARERLDAVEELIEAAEAEGRRLRAFIEGSA